MTTTVRPAPRVDSNGSKPSIHPTPARRRRVPLAIVAGLVAVGCALLSTLLYRSAGERELVLVLRAAVPAGHVLTANDLTARRVSVEPGVHTISANRRAEIVGLQAAVDLVPGSLLSTAQLGEPLGLETGEAVVSLALPDADTPPLGPGDWVRIIRTEPTGSQADSLGTVLGEGRVSEVAGATAGAGRLSVALIVDEDLAPEVAGAAAADRVRLVRVAAR